MKLNIQLFGGRGASSKGKRAKKTNDLKVQVLDDGYKLGKYYMYKFKNENGTTAFWTISTRNREYVMMQDFLKDKDKGKAVQVDKFQDAKEKLVELAIKKKRGK